MVMQELKEISSGRIIWKEGSLYPVLKKLETKKLAKAYWNVNDFDRPRKYYRILHTDIDELISLLEEQELMAKVLTN